MDYVNSRPAFKAQIRFGTLSDYFMGVWAEKQVDPGEKPAGYTSLSGDFFTYADRKDNYWSGYFTSRPFYKHLDRVLEASIRASEIAFSLGGSVAGKAANKLRAGLGLVMTDNRRQLALFQHHDGITGTAKDAVVVDYGNRMVRALEKSQQVVAKMAELLVLSKEEGGFAGAGSGFLAPEATRAAHDRLPVRKVVVVDAAPKAVVVFNPLGRRREQLVSVICDSADVRITTEGGAEADVQINPVWDEAHLFSKENTAVAGRVEVWFRAVVPPFGFATYHVSRGQPGQPHAALATVKGKGFTAGQKVGGAFRAEGAGSGGDWVVSTAVQTATFDQTSGLLKSVTTKPSADGALAKIVTEINLEFVTYGVGRGKDRQSPSGAYLFMPDGAARAERDGAASVRVVEGRLMSEVSVVMNHVRHTARLFDVGASSSGGGSVWDHGISLANAVDVSAMGNKELVMRVRTNVRNDKVFFTDLNGFQMRRRTTLSKLPLQANFFPLPGMAFLEDEKQRVSVHSRSSLGCASLEAGWFEVVLDRRLTQDDNRGLFQKVTDNKVTLSQFVITIERRTSATPKASAEALTSTGYPSLFGNTVNDWLNYPMYKYLTPQPAPTLVGLDRPISSVGELPCDVHLVNLRTLQPGLHSHLALLHRKGYVCDFETKGQSCEVSGSKVDLGKVFSMLQPTTAEEHSLTLMHAAEGAANYKSAASLEVSLTPMEIHAWKIEAAGTDEGAGDNDGWW
jgi:alpha-mannosidase II